MVRIGPLPSFGPLALALIGLCLSTGCDLRLDATREVPPDIARRIAQKRADLVGQPENATKQIELAELYIEAEQFFEAADTLRAAEAKGAEGPRLHAGLAEAYLELGYFQACAEQLRNCLSKNRDEPGCLYVFGSLMEGINDPQAMREAQRSYTRLLQVAPDFRKAKLAKSALDQIEARLATLPAPPPKAASLPAAPPAQEGASPEQPAAPNEAGAAAVATPGHGSGVDPATGEEVGGLNLFGQALMKAIEAVRRDDAPAAEAAFREALKVRPDEPAALAGLAEAEFAQGKRDAAVATIEKAYAKDPKDPQVRWAFGRIMIEARKRTDDAVKAWESLLADEPEYAKQLGVPARLEAMKKFVP